MLVKLTRAVIIDGSTRAVDEVIEVEYAFGRELISTNAAVLTEDETMEDLTAQEDVKASKKSEKAE